MEKYDQRVLVVDDDDAVRTLCSVNLELKGLSVLEAADGLDALALVRGELPDLVITDVSMPRLDGFELAAALRADERTSGIPLVFLSGETTLAHRTRADALGALAYLTKPFDPYAVATFVADTLFGGDTDTHSAVESAA
jgi:chemosensory pili system protein ChpA (sensor histidine kinase/response regulator)